MPLAHGAPLKPADRLRRVGPVWIHERGRPLPTRTHARTFIVLGEAKVEGLYMGNVAGGGLIRSSHKRGQTIDFTPDGTRVIYFEGDSGWVTDNPDEPNGSLFVINADGSGGPTLITPKDMQIGNLGGYIARLSRDGEWLIFAAEEDAVYGPRAIWKITRLERA